MKRRNLVCVLGAIASAFWPRRRTILAVIAAMVLLPIEVSDATGGLHMVPGAVDETVGVDACAVRALVLISAFAPHERWLGNGQLAHRTGLPPSTVTRIAQSLVHLGYLLYDVQERKYRLSPAVLGLGYAAIAHSAIQGLAGERMA